MDLALLLKIGADNSDLEKGVAAASKTLQKFGKEVSNLGKALTESITVPLAGLTAAALASSEGLDAAMNRIRAGTGATGDTLDSLGKTMRAVFADVPNTLGQVSEAVTDLYQRTKLTGPALQDMATTMLDLARITDGDVKPLIDSTQQAFQGWRVATQDQQAALDTLLKVSQATGISFQELSDTMGSGGTALRAIGMDFTQAAATIGQFAKTGISAEMAIMAITKESTKAAQNGQDMTRAFQQLLDQIKRAPTDMAAASIGAELFGKKSLQMAEAIRAGRFDVAELVKQVQASGETIRKAAGDTETLTQAMTKLGHDVQEALEPLGKAIARVLIDLVPTFQALIGVVSQVVSAFGALPQSVQTTVIVFGAMAAAAGPLLMAFGAISSGWASVVASALKLKDIVSPALAAISQVATKAGLAITEAFGGMSLSFASLGEFLASVGSSLLTFGAGLVELAGGPIVVAVAALALLASKWQPLGDAVVAAVELIGAALKKGFEVIKNGVASFAKEVGERISDMFADISRRTASWGKSLADFGKQAGDGFWDAVTAPLLKVEQFVYSICDKIKAAIQGLIQWATDALNGLTRFMNSVKAVINGDVSVGMGGQVIFGGGAATDKKTGPTAAPPKGQGSKTDSGVIIDYGAGAGGKGGAAAGGSTGGASSGGSAGGSGSASVRSVDAPTGWTSSGPKYADGPVYSDGPYSQQDTEGAPAKYKGAVDAVAARYALAAGPKAPAVPKDIGEGGTTISPGASTKGLITVAPDSRTDYGGDANPMSGGSLGPGDVPFMASGGIVSGATLAMIGESGPEAVIPLDKLRGMGGGTTIHVHVYGTVATHQDLTQTIMKEMGRFSQRNNGLGFS